MKALVAVALVALGLAVLSVEASKLKTKSSGRLDVMAEADAIADSNVDEGAELHWDILGTAGLKDKLHEAIGKLALDQLQVQVGRAKKLFDWKAMELGIEWPDMPTAKPNDRLPLLLFTKDFLSKDMGSLVKNSHYGCLQHLHSMAPVFSPRKVDAQMIDTVYFTNADVKGFIVAQFKYLYGRAVAAARRSDIASYSHVLGIMMHMLGDSYAPGHCIRGTPTKYGLDGRIKPVISTVPARLATAGTDPLESITERCGTVINFQGYGTQHGNSEHGATDHDPADLIKGALRKDKAVRRQLVRCSVSANYRLLKVFYDCAVAVGNGPACAVDKLDPLLNSVFSLSLPNELAGGSDKSMADPKYDKTKFEEIAYTVTNVIGESKESILVAPKMPSPLPPNARRWVNVPADVGLCAPIVGRSGTLSMQTVPFTDFFNPDSAGQDRNLHK